MDAKLLAPFVDAFFNVLPQLGFAQVEKSGIALKDRLMTHFNVTTMVGLTEKIRGNVAYSMSEATARQVASKMMMGMPVADFDEMAQSAISELSNMVAANAAIIFEGMGMPVQISPPTMVIGDNVYIRLSKVKTIAVTITTEVGEIELNIGIEV